MGAHLSSDPQEDALDILSDFASDVDHDEWLGVGMRRRLRSAMARIERGRDLRDHEVILLEAVYEQQREDLEQAAWERLGGVST